ncbi:PIN domain nuclease [soil metagenome]
MKVIVDTSVWSLAIRRKTPSTQPEVTRLAELIADEQPVYLLGVILFELLSSIKEHSQALKIRRHLESFPLLDLDRSGYVNAATLGSHCRSKGIQAGTVDLLIAQTAIEYGCHLLTTDKDFVQIARHSSLRLL